MKIYVLKKVLCRRSQERRTENNDNEEEEAEKDTTKPKREAKKINRKEAYFITVHDNRCACCLKPLVLSRIVRCFDCGARTCQKKCSRLDQHLVDCWCCLFCYQQRAWLYRNPRWFNVFDRLNIESDIASNLATSGTESNLYRDNFTVDTKSAVYTAIRKLVDHAVDEVQKLPNLERSGSNNSCQDQYHVHQDFTLSQRTHDNLLATVILNKVIGKHEFEQTVGNGNVLNAKPSKNNLSNAPDTVLDRQNQNCDRSLELRSRDLHPATLASKFTQTRSSGPVSLMFEKRIEEVATYVSDKYIRIDSDGSLDFCKSHPVPFPELGTDIINPCQELLLETCQNEEDDPKHVNNVTLANTWKENWLFRKRNSQERSSSVSMFVPNSNIEYRALIGDKDIDETSDLSEYSTYSDDDIERELEHAIRNVFSSSTDCECNETQLTDGITQHNNADVAVTSTTTNDNNLCSINENATEKNFHSDLQSNSEIQSLSSPLKEDRIEIANIHTEIQKETKNTSDVIVIKDQQDRECGEHNTLVPRRHCNGIHDNADIPVSVADTSSIKQQKVNGRKFENGITFPTPDDDSLYLSASNNILEDKINLFAPPKPGSIAYQEHKKWENAVPIKNNPYSKENLQKRLAQKQNVTRLSAISRYDITVNENGLDTLREDKDSLLVSSVQNSEILEDGRKNNKNDKFVKTNVKDVLLSEDNEMVHNDLSRNIHNQNRLVHPIDLKANALEKNTLSNSICNFKSVEQQVENKLNNRPVDNLKVDHLKTQPIKNFESIYNLNLRKENQSRNIDNIVTKKIVQKHQGDDDSRTSYLKNKNSSSDSGKAGSASRPLDCSLSTEVDKADDSINDKITLPSVKKIVQAFNEKLQEKTLSALIKPEKLSNKSESEQVEIQQIRVRQSPKQMHSLTARSLSKEFREGLRQVPKKS